jgi:hypothetical protein
MTTARNLPDLETELVLEMKRQYTEAGAEAGGGRASHGPEDTDQVLPHWLGPGTFRQAFRVGEGHPPDLGQLPPRPGIRAYPSGQHRSDVGDEYPGDGVAPGADNADCPDAQASLLEGLARRGGFGALARLDLPAGEHPRRAPVSAAADKDQAVTGDDSECDGRLAYQEPPPPYP